MVDHKDCINGVFLFSLFVFYIVFILTMIVLAHRNGKAIKLNEKEKNNEL